MKAIDKVGEITMKAVLIAYGTVIILTIIALIIHFLTNPIR